jgi:hypothetical protein
MNKKVSFVVAVGLTLAGVVAGFIAGSAAGPIAAQGAAKYTYFHFTAGNCRLANGQFGQGIIDLRNGNSWCVPDKPGPVEFGGTLNLEGVPTSATER